MVGCEKPNTTPTVEQQPEEPIPGITELTYKSTELLEIREDGFDTFIVSHTWDDGVGTIKFLNPISNIGFCAFESANTLTEISIPYGITSIDEYAFRFCWNLTKVTLPESLQHIGEEAFYNCESLSEITIPNSTQSIDKRAFAICTNLETFKGKFATEDGRALIIDDKIVAFAPKGISAYKIPDYVTTVGDMAFSHSNLAYILIPYSVTTIEKEAFDYCHELTDITIPDSVKSIGPFAFYGCLKLTSIFCLSETPAKGGMYMFDGNFYQQYIYVPSNAVEAYKSAEYWNEYATRFVGYDW